MNSWRKDSSVLGEVPHVESSAVSRLDGIVTLCNQSDFLSNPCWEKWTWSTVLSLINVTAVGSEKFECFEELIFT
jgi:hypothetical protein